MNIFLDLDGTLLDVSKKYYFAHTLAAKKVNANQLSFKKYWSLKKNKIVENEIMQLDPMSEIFKAYNTERLQLLESPDALDQDTLFPEVLKLLKKLKKQHKLYLVTLRGERLELEIQLSKLGIQIYFDQVLSARPSKDPVKTKLLLLGKICFHQDDILIGDTEVDILVAKELGLKSIAVTSGIRTKAFLEGFKPDFLVDNLASCF